MTSSTDSIKEHHDFLADRLKEQLEKLGMVQKAAVLVYNRSLTVAAPLLQETGPDGYKEGSRDR